MSLRPSVAEQSAPDAIDAGPFFAIFVFIVANVKRMAHVRTCHGPVARRSHRAQNLIRPVEPQDPGVLKKSRSFVNRRRRNECF